MLCKAVSQGQTIGSSLIWQLSFAFKYKYLI